MMGRGGPVGRTCLELIRPMRSSEPPRRTPLVVIGSEASERDRDRGLSLGVNADLAKPFTVDARVATVRALVPDAEGAPP